MNTMNTHKIKQIGITEETSSAVARRERREEIDERKEELVEYHGRWREITIEKMRTGKLLKESDKETGHKKTIMSLTKSADSSHLLTSSLDKSTKLWDIRSLTLIKTYVTERPVNAVAMSPLLDHDASAVTTTDHCAGKFEAKFFDKVLQEEIGGVKGHFGPINALAFNPDGKRCILLDGVLV
ncbi:Eukaryotic translation initiation factor 3 subunit I [Camellia lanceoleosa]|uniref:Eukaryotic translation initiation factor 3 subunit I n=1 Tax=Camellia lanceoleosa TaxID=1840588 RepID=A0ACC0FT37_9ERIC|nr:Eukaryotic translation initiation factor 3 subunit I [Camellia lanceoleosa]